MWLDLYYWLRHGSFGATHWSQWWALLSPFTYIQIYILTPLPYHIMNINTVQQTYCSFWLTDPVRRRSRPANRKITKFNVREEPILNLGSHLVCEISHFLKLELGDDPLSYLFIDSKQGDIRLNLDRGTGKSQDLERVVFAYCCMLYS